MGRHKKESIDIRKHVLIDEELNTFLEEEAKNSGISFSEILVKYVQKGRAYKIRKYQGLMLRGRNDGS